MTRLWKEFVDQETGQDLIEYTLLLAFVVLSSAALVISAGVTIGSLWTKADSRLGTVNQVNPP